MSKDSAGSGESVEALATETLEAEQERPSGKEDVLQKVEMVQTPGGR